MVRSLSFQLLSGFILFAALLIVLLIAGNNYAIQVVRSQVSDANRGLLDMYTAEMERQFEEVNNYLYGLVIQDPDVQTMLLDNDPGEYYFAKQRMIGKFNVQMNIMRAVGAFIVYRKPGDDLIDITRSPIPAAAFDGTVRRLTREGDLDTRTWFPVEVEGRFYFLRLVGLNEQIYVGSVIGADTLTAAMPMWSESRPQGLNLLGEDGALLAGTGMPAASTQAVAKSTASKGTFRTVRDPATGASLLAVGRKLETARATVYYTIPENRLLANLPNFRRLINWIPWVTLLLIAVYLAFMQQVLLKPMRRLVRGMQRIKKGNWDTRLPVASSSLEFAQLNTTFNQMASEINELKLDVYEKQLLAQEARFKQLQTQINPHFFMNALNIAYSLAGLEEYQLAQKLLQHIVDYLRFITRNAAEWVTLEQEFSHIGNYLEIQHMRFPHRMRYSVQIDPGLSGTPIPPLIVQPLAENAMIHGFAMEQGVFRVDLRAAALPGGGIEVTVTDNGPGFTEELLLAWSGPAGIPERHIGLRNIIERLSIKYKGEASLSFGNGPEGGAVVRLSLPPAAPPALASGDDGEKEENPR